MYPKYCPKLGDLPNLRMMKSLFCHPIKRRIANPNKLIKRVKNQKEKYLENKSLKSKMTNIADERSYLYHEQYPLSYEEVYRCSAIDIF